MLSGKRLSLIATNEKEQRGLLAGTLRQGAQSDGRGAAAHDAPQRRVGCLLGLGLLKHVDGRSGRVHGRHEVRRRRGNAGVRDGPGQEGAHRAEVDLIDAEGSLAGVGSRGDLDVEVHRVRRDVAREAVEEREPEKERNG